jgi:pimeloyl-ACP methyl ester carboxylesterase
VPAGDTLVCGEPAKGAEIVTFTDDDGASVEGVLLGEGEVGLVLAHQRNSDLCSWLPFARSLEGSDFRALAFTFAGELETNVAAAAAELRARGVEAVALVGASMGGTASLVAATEIEPPVDAVVALSAPREFTGLDADRAVRELDVPTLFVAGKDEVPFAADARALFRAAVSRDKDLFLAKDFAHGTDLFDGPEGPRVRTRILRFLGRLAPE